MRNRILFWSFVTTTVIFAASFHAQTHDHAGMAAADGEFNPYVVAGKEGKFYVAYIQRKGSVNDVMLQHSAGAALSAPVRVNNNPGDAAVRNENPPKVAVGLRNDVYVVWASERERWKGNIRFARSINGGRTFEPAIDLNSGASQQPVGRAFQSIAVDATGRIYVAWIDERNKTSKDRAAEIWMATSEDGGKTFSRDRKILSDVCECCRTALAVDSTGRVYISYHHVPSTGPMFRDIAVARSDDGGKTFRPTIVSSDRWELDGCPIAGATMTIDSADRIHVVWFTQRGDTPRLFMASSANHGSSFSPPKVFDPAQKLAKHSHAVAVSGNRVLVAWDDINSASTVKWGTVDFASGSLELLGSRAQASYPIIAINDGRIAVTAHQSNRPDVFRSIQNYRVR